MDNKKVSLGQFFTAKSIWLKQQIIDFMKKSACSIAYDPFAGAGDILNAVKDLGFVDFVGADIDEKLAWEINDSLLSIPHIDNAIIVTNPPYLAKQSASRKKLDLTKYFSLTNYDDLYLIALEKMLESQDYVVAIIPESFLNSSFKDKNRLNSVTILEENPFNDTECPVCVACFDGIKKDFKDIKIYKNNKFVETYASIEKNRLEPNNKVKMIFNDKTGWLALRAVDSTNPNQLIHFAFKDEIDYDWEHNIKVSSRHMTLINICVEESKRQALIDRANEILNNLRKKSSDVLLTPFMGNRKDGVRRRRLDFRLARAIIELAYKQVEGL